MLVSTGFALLAQQSDADRKLLAVVRDKAEKGDAQSQFELADAFAVGCLGLTKNEADAVKWYREAAEQNLAAAQFRLGVCYEFGQGVAKDEVDAVKWYRKAAEQNHPWAQWTLGGCYEDGRGVVNDEVDASLKPVKPQLRTGTGVSEGADVG